MFGRKKIVIQWLISLSKCQRELTRQLMSMQQWMVGLQNAHNVHKHVQPELKAVTCETCGCLVDPKVAINGADEIRVAPMTATALSMGAPANKVIYTPRYCKRCAPKPETKKGPR